MKDLSKEERLWEVQRILTALKRKLREAKRQVGCFWILYVSVNLWFYKLFLIRTRTIVPTYSEQLPAQLEHLCIFLVLMLNFKMVNAEKHAVFKDQGSLV